MNTDSIKDILYIIGASIGILGIFIGLYIKSIISNSKRDKKIDDNKKSISELSSCQKEIETKLDKIMDNHLPHIQSKIDKIDKSVIKLQTIIEERFSKK